MFVTFTFVTLMFVTFTFVTLTLRMYVLHMVGRHVWLVRRERKPRHPRPAGGADREAPVPPAHEHHQRGRVHRPLDDATRHPRPPVAPVHPAAVVEWREAPRCIVEPGPAPGLDPGPVSVAIRRPSRDHWVRHPHGPVVGGVTPVAVVVQVLVADRLA